MKPLTDSPWFWLLLFSLFGALAVVAIGGKYGKRQSGIERKYQAHQRLAEAAATATDAQPADRRPYSSERSTLIPLWPLAVVLVLISVVAGILLRRERITARAASEQGVK